MKKVHQNQLGLSLLELLIAIFLGVVISAALIQVLITNKNTTRFQNEIARLQENGRFAVEVLARDLRSADYWGCIGDKARVTNHVPNTDTTAYFDIQNTINGTDGSDDDTPDTLVLTGSQLINEAKLKPNTVNNTGTAVGFTKGGSFDPATLVGQAIVVANCQQSDIFKVISINTTDDTLVHNKTLSGNYDDRAFFYSPVKVEYSINNETLIRKVNGTDSEIASGIKNMQVYYGEDTSGNGIANRYVSKADVTDMNSVSSVKIHLLVSTPSDNVAKDKQVNSFSKLVKFLQDDNPDTSSVGKYADNKLYYPFTVTVAVRNRVL